MFVREGNFYRAGIHIIIDVWGAERLGNLDFIQHVLEEAALSTGATIIGSNFHSFGEGIDEGVTGVVLLAESHMSCHTWPEKKFAAFDIFTCGKCDPENAVAVINKYLRPERLTKNKIIRGKVLVT